MKVVVLAVITTDEDAERIDTFLGEFATNEGWVYTHSIHEMTKPLKVQLL